ncbi:MAG: hypothetical protein A2X53_12835 [Candidatus Rokubacteria bacterium GWA2_70_23]|nr:MAG: hypothetical protein A2X53_12835 [Candidatus Rokubacteria bacterium GWA2_70_23]
MIPDQAARDLIRERLDVNMLVEAGAGSGKTQSLAGRMAAGIAEGRYLVDHMAAVTFTRKAAAELRGRFQLELENRLRTEQDPGRAGRLSGALGHLERLFAGTIHAFCAHLLRERPVEAGVVPGFAELDETAEAELLERAWREYLDRERAQGSPLLQQLTDSDLALHELDEAFKDVCRHADVDFPAPDGAAPDLAEAWAALRAFWSKIEARLPDPIPEETTCGVQQRARELRGRLRVADTSRHAALAELLARWKTTPKIVQKWWTGGASDRKAGQAIKAELERLIGDFQTTAVESFLAAWREHLYGLAVRLLVGGRAFAEEARRRADALSYGDLLRIAARLLRDRPELRAALQRKYRWLFVDEFQDTDPIQAEVFLLLAAEPGAGPDWTEAPLRPGALFIVGDPKQSIYRFRRADIDTYTRVKERIQATGGMGLELTASFRSVPVLCRWANEVFPAFFPAEATREQPAFHGLDPVHPDKDKASTGIRQLLIGDDIDRALVPAADAASIARFIRAEVDGGRRAFGDFLILTRKKKNVPVYARALEALRIPTEVSGGAAFVESEGVAALAGLLRALADPDDGVALVGVLRGPLFGLSDPELFEHREAGHRFMLMAPLPDEAQGPVVGALRALQAMHRWTRILPAPAAVERLLETTGLLARGAASPSGAEAGHLLHAVDRLRQVTETGGSLADAARALEEDLESTDVDSVPLEPGRRDVVRLMNLHKAKGLEGTVVFLANPLAGVKPRAVLRIVRDGARATGYFQIVRPDPPRPGTVLAQPADWPAHAEAEIAYVEAEEHRLLYVAATRAKELLVISRYAGGGGWSPPWEPLASHLDGAPVLEVPGPTALPAVAVPDLGLEAREQAATARATRQARASAPSWQVESVTATAHHAGPAGHPVQESRTREPDTGMQWGSLIHFLLEHAMRSGARDRAHLERLASWYAFDKPELRPVVPEALDTVERVMAAEFWQRALAAEERHVEVPFAARIDGAGGTPPTILHGVIDLAFRGPEGWELIDYKTDQEHIARLADRYAPQVKAYAEHWGRLLGRPPAFAGLYAVRNGELSTGAQLLGAPGPGCTSEAPPP